MNRAEFDSFAVPLEGRNVVTASAGTGKTYAITTLVLRLVVELGLDLRQILVVTFTEAATAELRARIRRRLSDAAQAYRLAPLGKTGDAGLDDYVARRKASHPGDLERLEVALAHLDEAAISTIHGFCLRMLQEGAFESNARYDAELVTDVAPLRDEILQDAWAVHVASLPRDVLERVGEPLLPTRLRGLIDKITRTPGLEVLLPDDGGFPALFERARALWTSDRAAIEQDFVAAVGDRHLPRYVKGWLAEVETFLTAPPGESATRPPGVERLSGKGVRLGRYLAHPFAALCRQLVAAYEHLPMPSEAGAVLGRLIDHVREELRKRKEDRGVLSFDDLLQHLQAALKGPRGERLRSVIREQFRAALVDEFQDTDPTQLSIFDSVWAEASSPLFFIGDPKQAIYSFRGADVFTYLSAAARPGMRHHTMGTSYRSDPRLLDALNAVFAPREGAPPPFLLGGIPSSPVAPRPGAAERLVARGDHSESPFEVLLVPASAGAKKVDLDHQVAPLVAREISSLVRSGSTLSGRPVTSGDIAVLTRTNKQCVAIQAELRLLGIPAVLLGDRSVFESAEAREVQRILGAIVEPSQGEIRKALATELLGVAASELAAMEADPGPFEDWVARFREWGRLWVERGLVQTFDAVLTQGKVPERLLSLVDGERRMTNVLHLLELLRAAADESHLGPAGLLHWLGRMRSDTDGPIAEHAQIRLESDEAAVKLTTIHKSKGLEYPIVYCPYLWGGSLLFPSDKAAPLFHDPEDGNRPKLDLGSARHAANREHAELEALAENLRLAYVALTRAKSRVVVVWGKAKHLETSALGALLVPPTGIPPGDPVAIHHYQERVPPLPDDAFRVAWEDLSVRAGGAIALREVDLSVVGQPVPRPASGEEILVARERREAVAGFPWVRSFSGLTRSASEGARGLASPTEARDHDEQAPELVEVERAPKDDALPIVLAEFERGATAGIFYHSLLEHTDFRAPGDLSPRVLAGLRQFGLLEEHEAAVRRSVEDVLATPLLPGDPSDFRLAEVSPERRLNELEFHLPVADRTEALALSAAGLAAVFREHPSPQIAEAYAAELGSLSFSRFRGFLKGYVDLVLEHQGRFYVVDYKTNFLGKTAGDYAAVHLGGAMAHGHYFLQYHLYSLAVHRYLARRLPGYDYDTHFGGALYLFVRGMSPQHSPGRGVFFEKPPRARIEALSHLLDGAGEGGPR